MAVCKIFHEEDPHKVYVELYFGNSAELKFGLTTSSFPKPEIRVLANTQTQRDWGSVLSIKHRSTKFQTQFRCRKVNWQKNELLPFHFESLKAEIMIPIIAPDG